jgi:hypothetical protein
MKTAFGQKKRADLLQDVSCLPNRMVYLKFFRHVWFVAVQSVDNFPSRSKRGSEKNRGLQPIGNQQQGDPGLDNTTKFFGNRLAHNSSIWTFAIEHSGEHYGQLVVYYRANNLVPPDSRRQ